MGAALHLASNGGKDGSGVRMFRELLAESNGFGVSEDRVNQCLAIFRQDRQVIQEVDTTIVVNDIFFEVEDARLVDGYLVLDDFASVPLHNIQSIMVLSGHGV